MTPKPIGRYQVKYFASYPPYEQQSGITCASSEAEAREQYEGESGLEIIHRPDLEEKRGIASGVWKNGERVK